MADFTIGDGGLLLDYGQRPICIDCAIIFYYAFPGFRVDEMGSPPVRDDNYYLAKFIAGKLLSLVIVPRDIALDIKYAQSYLNECFDYIYPDELWEYRCMERWLSRGRQRQSRSLIDLCELVGTPRKMYVEKMRRRTRLGQGPDY